MDGVLQDHLSHNLNTPDAQCALQSFGIFQRCDHVRKLLYKSHAELAGVRTLCTRNGI